MNYNYLRIMRFIIMFFGKCNLTVWGCTLLLCYFMTLSYLLICAVCIPIFSLADSFEDLVYPQGEPDAVVVRKQDIELLKPRRFINDTIIDFYIK